MTKYETLLSEYEHIDIQEKTMLNDGLYADGHIWIREDMTVNKKYCVLAEEIGHHETSYGDILDQRDLGNYKQEHTARAWAYKKILPKEKIREALSKGHTELYDIAEYLDVDEAFLRACLERYGMV